MGARPLAASAAIVKRLTNPLEDILEGLKIPVVRWMALTAGGSPA
jgi:hypothetical protein